MREKYDNIFESQSPQIGSSLLIMKKKEAVKTVKGSQSPQIGSSLLIMKKKEAVKTVKGSQSPQIGSSLLIISGSLGEPQTCCLNPLKSGLLF